jgi:hypothetical protein
MSPLNPCRWCGIVHIGVCPLVKALDFHPDGTVKRVEFHAPMRPGAACQVCLVFPCSCPPRGDRP